MNQNENQKNWENSLTFLKNEIANLLTITFGMTEGNSNNILSLDDK